MLTQAISEWVRLGIPKIIMKRDLGVPLTSESQQSKDAFQMTCSCIYFLEPYTICFQCVSYYLQ